MLIVEISDKVFLDGYIDLIKIFKVIFIDVFEKGDCWFDIGDMLCDIGFGYV